MADDKPVDDKMTQTELNEVADLSSYLHKKFPESSRKNGISFYAGDKRTCTFDINNVRLPAGKTREKIFKFFRQIIEPYFTDKKLTPKFVEPVEHSTGANIRYDNKTGAPSKYLTFCYRAPQKSEKLGKLELRLINLG